MELLLHLKQVPVDVFDILSAKLRVVIVILIYVVETELLLKGICHAVDVHGFDICFIAP